jgi:hypothetical protein
MEEKIEKRKSRILEKFNRWLEKEGNKLFLGIFIFSIIVRLYFFFQTLDQAVWWDAGDYLSQAKYIGGLIKFEYIFNPRRPFFLAVLWGTLFRLGFGETMLRITELLFSIFGILGMYLIGKKMFNYKVGLISSFLLAIFWQHLFFSFRLMTEIPTLTFFLFAMYFFWRGYVKKEKPKIILPLFGLFLGLSLLTRGGTLMMGLSLFLFLITTDKLKFLKNKYLWISGLIFALVMSTFFIFIYFQSGGNPVKQYVGIGEGRFSARKAMGLPGILTYSGFFPEYLGWALLIPFLLGLLIFLSDIFIRLDLIWKDNLKLKKNLFLFFWIIVPFLFHSIVIGHMEPRYLIMAFPPFFIILSQGLLKIKDIAEKYQKQLGLILIVLILILGSFYQLNRASSIIQNKKESYMEVKRAGLWIKENSSPGDVILSMSIFQNMYYSERKTLRIPQNQTEFHEMVDELKPEYYVVSIFENHPSWTYSYPEETPSLFPVKVYKKQNKPVLIIYKFLYNSSESF